MVDQPQVILAIILFSSWVVVTPYVHELPRGVDNHTAAIGIVWQRKRRACNRGSAQIHPPSPQMGSLPTANGDPVTAVSAPVCGSMLAQIFTAVMGWPRREKSRKSHQGRTVGHHYPGCRQWQTYFHFSTVQSQRNVRRTLPVSICNFRVAQLGSVTSVTWPWLFGRSESM
jgi:hypothetical protein